MPRQETSRNHRSTRQAEDIQLESSRGVSKEKDLTQYIKYKDGAAVINLKNEQGRTHEYRLEFDGKGLATIKVHDVTPDWIPGVFDYKEERKTTLSKSKSVDSILKNLDTEFTQLLKKNSPWVSDSQAMSILRQAYLTVGANNNLSKLTGSKFFYLNSKVKLDNSEHQQIVISNGQREFLQRGEYNCLASTKAALTAMWSINPRNIDSFKSDEAAKIFHKLRGPAVHATGTVSTTTTDIQHKGKSIGTFHSWESRVGDVSNEVKDIAKNAPIGSMIFMRDKDRSSKVTHVGFITEKGVVCHNIGESQLKNKIDNYRYNDSHSVGISEKWEICGAFIPNEKLLAVPQKMELLHKCYTNVTVVSGSNSNLSLSVTLGELSEYLVAHSKYFKGQSPEHVAKAIFDLNPTLIDPNQNHRSATLDLRIRTDRGAMPIRLMNHWIAGVNLSNRLNYENGSKSGTLKI